MRTAARNVPARFTSVDQEVHFCESQGMNAAEIACRLFVAENLLAAHFEERLLKMALTCDILQGIAGLKTQ